MSVSVRRENVNLRGAFGPFVYDCETREHYHDAGLQIQKIVSCCPNRIGSRRRRHYNRLRCHNRFRRHRPMYHSD